MKRKYVIIHLRTAKAEARHTGMAKYRPLKLAAA